MIDTLAVAADGVVNESEGQVEPHRQQNSDPVNNRLELNIFFKCESICNIYIRSVMVNSRGKIHNCMIPITMLFSVGTYPNYSFSKHIFFFVLETVYRTYPWFRFHPQLNEHDGDALWADEGAPLPEPHGTAGVRPVRDEEEDQWLVDGLGHVDPETVRLVHCTQPRYILLNYIYWTTYYMNY